jgi:chromosome partitioning protein
MQAMPRTQASQAVQAGHAWNNRRLVITNQKGGQGKTTTTVNLGAELAARGARVRMIDCDPQIGSASYWLPPQWEHVSPEQRYDLYHLLVAPHVVPNSPRFGLDHVTWATTVPGLFIVPSYHSAGQYETMRIAGAEYALREAIDAAEPYDVTIIDCPPNLGMLTVTAITAADDVIIPCKSGGLDMAGVSDLNQTLNLVKARLNSNFTVRGVLLTDKLTSNFSDAVEKQLVADYPEAIHQIIRHTIRVGEAPTVNQTLQEYAPDSTALEDYRKFADMLYPTSTRAAG